MFVVARKKTPHGQSFDFDQRKTKNGTNTKKGLHKFSYFQNNNNNNKS